MANNKKEIKPISLPVAVVCALLIFALMALFIVYLSGGPLGMGDTSSQATIDEGSFAEPTPDEPEQSQPTEVKEYMSEAEIGDAVIYGNYLQDGEEAQPIEWIVLNKTDEQLTLISRYCLDCVPYNTDRVAVSYQESSLYAWLNGEFINTAFTESQQANIISTGGLGKAYVLSAEEAAQYYEYDSWRKTAATLYAQTKGAKLKDNIAMWWLRDINPESTNAQYVYYNGTIAQKGFAVDYNVVAVRPVICVSANAEKQEIE